LLAYESYLIMTKKLYWNDPYLTHFTARVEDTQVQASKRLVVLDQTAFYPTGGGQPCDTGLIKRARVLEVETAEDGRILHHLSNDVALETGETVECEIDWSRRRELMQQHTGQHILSQAFFRLFGAETRGFRITDRASEIDLTLEAHQEEIEEAIIRAEEMANDVVFDNREIHIHELTQEDAAKLPLRKESFITECVRVVEIADFDWSPCGGTHLERTGEVGLIAIKGWERAKKMTRIHFVCGVRALRDYRAVNRTADAIARKFSVGIDETEASVARLFGENKRLSRRLRDLVEVAARAEAQELMEATSPLNGLRIISWVFEDRDFEELKLLAHRLVEQHGVIALLAAREEGLARIVFARSTDLSADMNALMKVACEKLGGRGGGKPDFAQGGGPNIHALETAITAARAELKNSS
jgi:alanyl-tRNA synthetase